MLRIIYILACATAAFATALSVRDGSCTGGTTTTSNGRNCGLWCGLDRPGGDYAAKYTSDFASCVELCSKDQNCSTAQFLTTNGYCYLKNYTNPVRQDPNVNTVICFEPPPGGWPTTTTAPPAPTATTCVPGYFTQENRQIVNQCGMSYGKSTDAGQTVASFSDCADLCAANSSCSIATYQQKTSFCQLTPSYTTAGRVAGQDSAVLYTTGGTPPAGCRAAAPPSPYLTNPGFELDGDGVDWIYQFPGQNGGISWIPTYKNGFEGCKALSFAPQGTSSKPFALAVGMTYLNLQIGKQHQLTFTIGQKTSSPTAYTAPWYSVHLEGKNVTSSYLCGFSNSFACPVNGTGGAQGQQATAYFTPTNSTGTFVLYLAWTSTGNEPILVDGFALSPS